MNIRTSRKLRVMYGKWRRQVKYYHKYCCWGIAEELYGISVSTIYARYPKLISQSNGNFNTVQVWSYGYLMRRVSEVLEEYDINVVL